MTIDKLTVIVGSPRSGTTWLAKIFDSHPRVLYRHEPDLFVAGDTIPPVCLPCQFSAYVAPMRTYMTELLHTRTLKSAGSLPVFRKANDTALSYAARVSAIYGLRLTRKALPRRLGQQVTVPGSEARGLTDLHPVIKSVSAMGRVGLIAAALPEARIILIIRNALGQVASRLDGIRRGKFEKQVEFDAKLLATPQARRLGLDEPMLRRLSLAEQLTWEWAVQNEKAMDDLKGAPRARVIRYRDLVDDPVLQAKALLAFAGLDWQPATEAFIARSTHYQGPDLYYHVYRDATTTKEKWRLRLSDREKQQIIEVMRATTVGQMWPDIVGS